jgi:hypothetical protein
VFDTMQMHGIAFGANTAIMGWGGRWKTIWPNAPDQPAGRLEEIRHLSSITTPIAALAGGKRIDVWWRGRDRNAEPCTCWPKSSSKPFLDEADIRVLFLINNEEGREGVARELGNC